MSAIFISHSSRDKEFAIELHDWLLGKGYVSVFLDLDRKDGIVAGDRWEHVLYRELRTCQVLIALISENWLSSTWCFAEATHAREKGKSVLGLRLSPTVKPSILSDTQCIDFHDAQRDSGYARLWLGLQSVIDPRGLLRWDARSRPLYPGLNAFDELDAPVYFGRDQEAGELVEALRAMRVDGEDPKRLLLLLGASGSGKSSLARAGVVHQLRRERNEWIIVDPFRPGMRPITEMAKAVETTFARYGKARGWEPIRETLFHSVKSANSSSVIDLADQLRMARGNSEATVLVVIDQLEELFTSTEESAIFLPLLKLILEAGGTPYRVLGTLRSDWLGQLQTHPGTMHLPYRSYHLELMKPENFRQVIEGPARIAGIDLESTLVDAMVADTKTADALPLLAYVLYELWKRYGADGKLTLEEYRERLGGIEGVINRTAENALGSLSHSAERAVRRAFSVLARFAEGKFIKQRARWSGLSTEVHPILDRFVQARLLVSDTQDGERVIEVAHETLFRGWSRLRNWLDEDRDFLNWREGLHAALDEWRGTHHSADSLLRGVKLAKAVEWYKERQKDLALDEMAFIAASIRSRNLNRGLIGIGVLTLALVLGMGAWVLKEGVTVQYAASIPLTRLHLTPVSEPKMEVIPAGTFRRGDVDDKGKIIGLVHEVKLKPFKIGKYEVTFEEYDRYVELTGGRRPADQGWGRGKRPVINVSWEDAVTYANWLSKATGKSYRLPTEAEWEYAARSGGKDETWSGTSSEGQLRDYGWFLFNSPASSQPVGRRKPNGLGLHDMSGNVFEWVEDCWSEFYDDRTPKDGSAWLEAERGACALRIVRGGSWNNYPENLGVSFRDKMLAGNRGFNIGFRLAQD